MNTKKKTFPMRTTLLLLLMMLTSLSVWANETFTVGDLTYILVSESSKTVNVNCYSSEKEMQADYELVIPASVTNPNNSTLYTVIGIDCSAFMNKTNLKSVSIPASMTRIGQQAFDGCTNLETVSIPEANGVTDVGGDAFSGTKWLNNQPNGVVYVGKVAYLGKNVSGHIRINDGAVSISEEAFLNCTGLTSVTIPNGVTDIGSSAFGGCTNLTSITIPNGVTYIGGSAFSGSGLTSITIPNGVTDICSDAFKGCTSLTSVTIPNSVTFIQDDAFRNCTSLTSITIPASVGNIRDRAFYKCTNLKTVTIYAPSCDLGTDAFSGCNDLQIYVFSDLVNTYKGAENWSKYAGIITAIPNQSGNCGTTNHESEVTWELARTSTSGVLTISGTGKMASYSSVDQYPWNDYRSSITSLVFESGVTSVCDGAFSGYSNLTSVTFQQGVETIGHSAFSSCSGLKSISIPNSVTTIYSGAFYGCTNVETLELGSGLTTIEAGVFSGLTSLTSLTIGDGVKTIYAGAFSGCTGLKNLTIGDGVTSIAYVFNDCTNLETIVLGAGLTFLNAGSFEGYTKLKSVTFKNGTSPLLIHEAVFRGCTSLETVTLPNNVTQIGTNAFSGCTSLTSMNIPASVTSIGESVFYNCTNLTSVALNGPTTIGSGAFPSNTTVTIASGLYLYNGTEPLSGTITDMTKLNGKTLQTTVPYTDDNGDPQSTTIDWATVNEGTQADPYMIYHPAQLLLLAYRVNGTHGETANDYSGKYFKLGANIAFSHEANEGDDYAENYEAIGGYYNSSILKFNGDFDGDGHTVSGIRLRKTGIDIANNYQGFFGEIGINAIIHDVNLTDARIKGNLGVGGIVGYSDDGTVLNCTVTESAITANNFYGTICGRGDGSTLQHNYYRHCTVNGTPNATNVGCNGADITDDTDGAMPMYVAYIDANGDEQKCTDYTILDNTMTTISAGWYVVKSDVAFSGDLSTNADGEVNIILCDGATLTASKIDPIGNSDQLCIYGQSQGTGTANISGEIMATCSIQIYGGNITAGGICVINGSLDLKGGTITAGTLAVNEGNINLAGATVKADNYGEPKSDVTIATGITYYDGEGHSYTEGNLSADQISAIAGKKLRTYDYRTVSYVKADGTSATVDARPLQGSTQDVTLGSDGATTWYVVNSNVNYRVITLIGNVNIILCDGKTMTSDGGSASAISGEYGYNNSLTIYGQSAGTGKLVAQCGEGNGISSGAITINGGTVDATGGDYSAINASGNITINGGNVSATGYPYGIEASGNIILGWTNANDHIYASSYSETVTIASGLVFTDGQGHNFYGTISDVSAIAGQTLQPVTNAIPYIDEDGTMACCTDFFVIDGSTTYFGNDNGWYVVNSNVTLNELRFTEKANIILCDGAKLTVKNNNVRGDITIPDNNNSSASITVYAQSAGTGAIEAGAIEINTSDITRAFITIYGGNVDINRLEAGNIYIYGGNITANTAENQTEAAILGNAETYIYGGSVTVTANGCNGIQSNQGNIHIYGGQVTATATGTGCYGISSVDNIRLRWTKATDFIQASSYKVGQNCDVYICDGQMMSDGTTIYSDHLDAQKDAIAGQKLVPYGFKTKANPHESDYWTSFYYGTANYSAPDGVTIYKAAIDGDHVQLTEVSGGIIRAGEAVILKTTASNVTTDGYLILPLTTTDATGDYSGNELKGVDDDTWQESGYTYYVLSKKGDNFGFFKLASSNMLGAHKAYLKVDAQNSTREFFGFDDSDSEDGIKSIDNGQLIIDNEAIYNLSGQKLSKPQKGINIVNGRKVLF